MIRLTIAILLCWSAALFAQTATEELPAANTTLQSNRDKASYAIGMNIGKQLMRDGLNVNIESLALGMQDALSRNKSRLSMPQLQAAMIAFQQEAERLREQKLGPLGEKNKAEGTAFLAKNKIRPGVRTLPSGLQYHVVKAGNGARPRANSVVRTHYRGALVDGTEFDSSYTRGQPAEFAVNQVIRGWTEALQLMKVGGKWKLFIPSELAYGPQGSPPDIGPHAVLVFDIELLGIN